MYKHSAWIFIGGLNYELTEGDVICVFSQYGEVSSIDLIRDKKTGKPKGFCFLCYEDQRSTVLAVDNLNGIKLAGRIIRVDHCDNYKPAKESSPKPKRPRH
jgi:RNA-binding motif protein, X-linked 2